MAAFYSSIAELLKAKAALYFIMGSSDSLFQDGCMIQRVEMDVNGFCIQYPVFSVFCSQGRCTEVSDQWSVISGQ